MLKGDKNEICNRVFKSRVKKQHILIEDYHQMVYEAWKSEVGKKKKQKNKNKSKHSRQPKEKRNKSIGV